MRGPRLCQVMEAVNGVSWVQQLAGYPSVSGAPIVGVTLDGLQRPLAKPKVRKEPVSGDMITALVESLGSNPTLSDLRLVAACLLAFSAFLRYDELSKLRCCDITFNASHMVIRISSSKTDQYRQGDSVVVARTGSSKCPVTMLERYYAMASISKESKLRLFRGIVSTKSGERLRSQGSLSYTRLRELFLQKLTSLGFDAKQFGLHSLSSGGATAAAQAGAQPLWLIHWPPRAQPLWLIHWPPRAQPLWLIHWPPQAPATMAYYFASPTGSSNS